MPSWSGLSYTELMALQSPCEEPCFCPFPTPAKGEGTQASRPAICALPSVSLTVRMCIEAPFPR